MRNKLQMKRKPIKSEGVNGSERAITKKFFLGLFTEYYVPSRPRKNVSLSEEVSLILEEEELGQGKLTEQS